MAGLQPANRVRGSAADGLSWPDLLTTPLSTGIIDDVTGMIDAERSFGGNRGCPAVS